MTSKQSVLVTGSSSGIGRAISETLARTGHTVFAAMRNVNGKNAAAAQELKTVAKQENLDLHVIEMDVTSDESVAKAIETVLGIAGSIDVLVNNAGVMAIGISEAMTTAQMQQMFDVNVMGTFRVNQAVLPHMRQRGSGYLVYISSTSSLIIFPFMGMYGATKAAVSGIAETMHYELHSLGIDTTILQCGGYNTDLPSNVQVSGHAHIAENYGTPGAIAQMAIGSFAANLGAASDPNELGHLIAEFMERPAGERPLHQAVGVMSEVLHGINDVMEKTQQQVISLMQLDVLTKRENVKM
jgi:NAD(P)-dependent dehydrogenase (short-subunit alcohol dehydrogenase family)